MRFLFFTVFLFAWLGAIGERVAVVDGVDGTPLPGATVFGRSGAIVGLTDASGGIDVVNRADFPLTVRCLGYETASCRSGEGQVKLDPATYGLKEVVVVPVERPVVHMLCYIREYISGVTGTDTIMNFNEHMGDFFVPVRKIKGFKAVLSPRFLRSRLYSRIADSSRRDSIFRPDYRDDTFAWEQLMSMPKGKIDLGERICGGAATDTVMGKHGVKELLRRNGNNLTVKTDWLADSKNHTMSPFFFKLLGLTIDLTELQTCWIVSPSDNCSYTAADIVSGTFSVKVTGRGKWIRKAFHTDTPVEMYSFYEVYPMTTDYLTVEQAKDMLSNPPSPRIEVSPLAPELSPAIRRLVEEAQKRLF